MNVPFLKKYSSFDTSLTTVFLKRITRFIFMRGVQKSLRI